MSAPSNDQARDDFDYFSNEYAQARQAFTAIEQQAATLLLMAAAASCVSFSSNSSTWLAKRWRRPKRGSSTTLRSGFGS